MQSSQDAMKKKVEESRTAIDQMTQQLFQGQSRNRGANPPIMFKPMYPKQITEVKQEQQLGHVHWKTKIEGDKLWKTVPQQEI